MTATAGRSIHDYVRRCIFMAHLPPVEFSAGVAGEAPTEYCVSRRSRSFITIENPEDLNGKRPHAVINQGLFQVTGREVRSSGSKLPLMLWQLENSPVVRVVQKLPEDAINWLRYAYTENYSWDHESGAAMALWHRFLKSTKLVEADLPAGMQNLAYAVLQDTKRRCNSGKKLYSHARLQQLSGLPNENWTRDYLPKIKVMRAVMIELDAAALNVVQRELDELEEASAVA